MENLEKKIIELRSKERIYNSSQPRWLLKLGKTGDIWKHFCGYSQEWTTVHIVRKNKRGFAFSVFFAGKYTNHFVSRGDIEIVYEL